MLPRFVAVPVSTRAPRNVSAANATTAQRWVKYSGGVIHSSKHGPQTQMLKKGEREVGEGDKGAKKCVQTAGGTVGAKLLSTA